MSTEPVVDLIRTQRQNVAFALATIAVVFLVGTIYFVAKANKLSGDDTSATEKDAEKDKLKDFDPDDPLKSLQIDSVAATKSKRHEFYVGAIACGIGMLLCGATASYLFAVPPKPTESEQRTEARVTVLALGALLGGFLLLTGAFYFYLWSESLMKWLDKGEAKEARWVIIPLLMVIAGGALMFVCIQPARAEERNNTSIRRMVYGSNFGLTMLLVFVVLVIANAIIVMRVPNKLDTTETGFYSLNEQTKQLLESLEQPIHAYAIFQEGSGDAVTEDTKRLLQSCQDANPSRFRVTFLSPALNRDDIAKLKRDYPLAEMSREGVLLVAGDEESADRKRHTFIRGDEFSEIQQGPSGDPIPAFNGEPKLLRELMFLAENKQRPKIYFTQSSGELSLGRGGRSANPRRSATMLKDYLERNYFEVADLTFELAGQAKVPDDAAVVVVADPTVPLPPHGVEAIRKFMTEPRPDGKKGKLIVLAGLQAGPDRKPLKTGLEPLLGTFGVQLPDRFLFAEPLSQLGDWDKAEGTRLQIAEISSQAVQARNPVALGFRKVPQVLLVDCREVTTQPGPGFQTMSVLVTSSDRGTWTETDLPTSSAEAWEEIRKQYRQILDAEGDKAKNRQRAREFLEAKNLTASERDLAVLVSESGAPGSPPTARVAVYGCGWFVSDEASGRAAGVARGQVATLWLDLMGSTLDWIRDRPTVSGVTEKPYSTYTLKAKPDGLRMKWVPLGLSFLVVLGVGAGVWVIRRK
ncbi:MAG: GldG family protein [Planctomycetia bacterium]|nr:GldG family protein [Planctomycetia bacterium]